MVMFSTLGAAGHVKLQLGQSRPGGPVEPTWPLQSSPGTPPRAGLVAGFCHTNHHFSREESSLCYQLKNRHLKAN